MAEKALICTLCNGEIQPYSGPRYSQKVGGFLILAGILTTLFWVGPVLGIPLLLIGLYMAGAKRQGWVCKECNTVFERVKLNPKGRT